MEFFKLYKGDYMNNFFKKIKKHRNCQDICLEELKDIIKINEGVVLVDVRSPLEFIEGHLNGAINIPLYELEICSECKLKDKRKIIVIYCQSGIRSKKAIRILEKHGFNNLYHLKGGLDAI